MFAKRGWGWGCAWVSLSVISAVRAGPDFIERDDAGSTLSTAKIVTGFGQLGGIKGSLSGPGFGDGDFEDMYLISITDPMEFSFSTALPDKGEADFDSQLWLFSYPLFPSIGAPQAFGILANDEMSLQEPGPAKLVYQSTDGSGAAIMEPGLYLVAITGLGNNPLSPGGEIFDIVDPTEISGPDGPGGRLPHIAWTGSEVYGDYRVNVTGASYIPEPAALIALIVGATTLSRRKRR